MSRKRKSKQGSVYLLKDLNNEHIYKFGCTTTDVEKRCKKVNSERKSCNHNFKVIASFKSFDIYQDEQNIKCNILNCGLGMLSEVFSLELDDGLNSDMDVIKRFLFLGGVLSKEYI